jgi:hypothetical protein
MLPARFLSDSLQAISSFPLIDSEKERETSESEMEILEIFELS